MSSPADSYCCNTSKEIVNSWLYSFTTTDQALCDGQEHVAPLILQGIQVIFVLQSWSTPVLEYFGCPFTCLKTTARAPKKSDWGRATQRIHDQPPHLEITYKAQVMDNTCLILGQAIRVENRRICLLAKLRLTLGQSAAWSDNKPLG
jgi:hypothetical protein